MANYAEAKTWLAKSNEQQSTIIDLRTQLSKKDEQILEMQSANSDLNAKLFEKDKLLKKLEDEATVKCDKMKAIINDLQHQLSEKDGMIAEINHEKAEKCDEMQAKINDLQHQLSEKDGMIAEMKHEAVAICNEQRTIDTEKIDITDNLESIDSFEHQETEYVELTETTKGQIFDQCHIFIKGPPCRLKQHAKKHQENDDLSYECSLCGTKGNFTALRNHFLYYSNKERIDNTTTGHRYLSPQLHTELRTILIEQKRK